MFVARRLILVALAAALASAAPLDGRTFVLYQSSFDLPAYDPAVGYWAGVDGWESSDPSNGTVAVHSEGAAVYLGYVPPAADFARVWRSFVAANVTPARTPIVRIESRYAIVDSTNGRYDVFGLTLYNRADRFIGGVYFDNGNNTLHWSDGAFYQPLQRTYRSDYLLGLAVVLDFSTNRVRFEGLGDDGRWFSFGPSIRMHARGEALDFGYLEWQWLITASGQPGNNYLYLDALTVSASTAPVLDIAGGRSQRISKATHTFRGRQPVADEVRVEWREKGARKWNLLSRGSDRWRLPLRGFQEGRTVLEFRLRNAAGKTIDRERITVLRRSRPRR